MNIAPNGPQLSSLLPLPQLPAPQVARPIAAAPEDSVTTLLAELSDSRLLDLIRVSGSHGGKAEPALLDSAVKLLQEHNSAGALTKLREFLSHAPDLAETIAAERVPAAARAGIETLVHHLKTEARADAELQLSLARAHEPAAGALNLAERLLETNRYGYLLVSAEISRYVASPRPVTRVSASPPAFQLPAELPMLLILWLITGLIAGVCALILRVLEFELWTVAMPFELWGAGSAGLIGYGTYHRLLRGKPALRLPPDRDH